MVLKSENNEEKSKINAENNYSVYNAFQGSEDQNYLVEESSFENQNYETIRVYRKRCKNL